MRGKDLGIAIVGSGRMGEIRGQIAINHPAVRFVACSDIDSDRARNVAGKIGAHFNSGSNWDVIAKPEVNAVIVSSIDSAHIEPVLQAIELGKPVLCEKPIGLSMEDADRIIAAVKRHPVDLRYGYSRRFLHRYLGVKEQVAQGRLGRIIGGHARVYNTRSKEKAKLKEVGITPVIRSLTYYIDLMCWFLEGNPVVEVFARGQNVKRSDRSSEEMSAVTWAILTCADGAVVNVGICHSLPEKYPSRGLASRVELLGTEGVLLIDGDNADQIMYSEHAVPHVHQRNQDVNMVFLVSSTAGQWAVGDFWGPLATETRAWLDSLSTGKPCVLATAADARRNLQISLAIEQSERSGERVRLQANN